MLGQRPSCPCGSSTPYDVCCGRLHRGASNAATPEELMRSRYAAFALGEADYLWRTWHPRTRPDSIDLDDSVIWTSLQIHRSGEDWVEFTAFYRGTDGEGQLDEHSRFAYRAHQWFYLDGDLS